jgi:hypothetical protein
MRLRILCALLAMAVAAPAQKYSGPRPPKADIPYLKHAENLIPTESGEAAEEKGKKEEITYVVTGAASPAKTPLASPIFLYHFDKLQPETLQLYKFEVRNGRREISFSPKKQPKAIRVTVTKLSADGIYRLEVDESMEPGEYALSPSGTNSNQVFCFRVE